ncbi:CPBP family intramembrane glutamic endopeptidase [Sporichthya sp.]|uniref:CPBP family intramembrane glutamic endopeptidase n=1 Tax=Sporichthya sp. TaxID=65475 RepID=UPI001817B77B|nr:CPBP family intramembrane glutamic endopeptidase [Sporichthya sp.]MBA3745050.1 CPBP family intramembrane metalloprotease [Sporichthya sp.]
MTATGRVREVLGATPFVGAPPPEDATDRRRRGAVVAATTVLGAVLTAFALNEHGTGPRFFLLTSALAATWLLGALLSGPVPLGRLRGGHDLAGPAALAALIFGVFVIGELIVSTNPYLADQVDGIIGHASGRVALLAALVAVVNGVGEELFFRGAAWSALARHRPEVASTVLYVVVIACSGILILVVAGVIMGAVFALQRRATAGVLASCITHVVWTLLMIALLPR